MATKRLRDSGALYKRRDKISKLFDKELEAQQTVSSVSVLTIDDFHQNFSSADLRTSPLVPADSVNATGLDNEDNLSSDEELDISGDHESTDEETIETTSFEEDLRIWALNSNITHAAMNSLLKILKTKKVVQSRLPKDYRTLLRTPHQTGSSLVTIGGGRMWYQGIQQCLQLYFCDVNPGLQTLWIDVSMDGLPLHRSGPTQFWPILMRLVEMPQVPVFVVAIFCGSTKPANVEEYLRQFVTEINDLQSNGVILHGVKHEVKLRAIIADSPARALIKGVVSYNGYHGCLKCTDIGVYDNAKKRMYFTGVGLEKRTDAKFRANEYPLHSLKPTPLTDVLYFDMIADVIIADRLHLIDLGIMRKLLKGWIKGTFMKGPYYTKWTPNQCDIISEFLLQIQLPSEIHRNLRSLQYVKFWKGTEFRTFLHYASVVVLKEALHEAAYKHFMLLFCAATILSSSVYESEWELAKQMLDQFVKDFPTIYGESSVSSNVHNIQHVYEDVTRFGPLEEISTYPFENELQHLKRLMRGGSKFLEQIVNRVCELHHANVATVNNETSSYPTITTKGHNISLHITPEFSLRKGPRNEWFLLKDNTIMKYCRAAQSETEGITVYGYDFVRQYELFDYPCSSTKLMMFQASVSDLSPSIRQVSVSDIRCKLVGINVDQSRGLVVIPLLHTLQT